MASNVTIDDRAFKQHQAERIARARDLTPVMQVIQQKIMTETDMNFRREQSPEGIGWEKSERAKKQNGKTLQHKGILRASISTGRKFNINKVDKQSVQVGTNLPYAPIHQYGGSINRNAQSRYVNFKISKSGNWRFAKKKKANFQRGVTYKAYTISMPQRRFIGITPKMSKEFNERITRYIITGKR